MEPIRDEPGLSGHLAADEAVDHRHPLVAETTARLRSPAGADPESCARAACDFVRDTVPHSYDSGDRRVAWRASDVLATRSGICYAKSHAPAALPRHAGIPAALCHRKLNAVHGLAAVKLPGRPWVRQDPRGNKPGVDARFSPEGERLAYAPGPAAGQYGTPVLYAAPPAPVLDALRRSADRTELDRLLPVSL